MTNLNLFPPDASADEIAAAIEAGGYAIIEGLLEAEGHSALKRELDPMFEAAREGHEDFMGHRTKRFGSLLGKSPASHRLALDPLVLAIAGKVLGPYCARIQLNYSGVMQLLPGEKAQPLHRDSSLYPFQNPAPPLILATMWALSDFTAENGGTSLVPGSHKWEDGRVPRPEEVVPAVMPAGSVLLYNGATIHAAGANRANAPRTGVAMQYALGWLRQEENQYMAVPIEQARGFPRELQELMGYDLATVNLGMVDHKHPMDVLNGTASEGPGHLGTPELYAADSAIHRFKVSGTKAMGRARFEVAAGG